MTAAAVTPRVRSLVICDEVSASRTEDRVFTLKRVRQHLEAASFPCRAALRVFLILSSPRKGKYPGKVVIVNERNGRLIRYVKFSAAFQADNELLPLYVDLGDCVFPEAGHYNFEVYFAARDDEALKGEHPFTVLAQEEGAMSQKKSRPSKFAPLQRVTAEEITDPAELAAIDEMLRKRRKRKQAIPKKTSRPSKFAPLQCVIGEPVTDPAEIAAMEEMRKRLKRKQRGRQATKNPKGTKAASSSAAKKRA